MKKRKELDALVTNGKAGKRSGKKGSESCSAHELLEHETDSSDMDDFTILQRRKSRKKVGSPYLLSTLCLPLCQFVLITTCILVSGTLVWLHIGLREDLDILRTHLLKVETGNRNTPEELHGIHSKLKELDSNVTALLTEIKKNIIDIENVTAEIKHLKEVTSSLQESIAAAPTITNLPKDVQSLSERVVAFGSKISTLDTTITQLKESQSNSIQSLYDELEGIKNTVHELSNATKASVNDSQKLQVGPIARDLSFQNAMQETKQQVSSLKKDLFELTTSVEKINSTLISEIGTYANLPAKIELLNSTLIGAINAVDDQTVKIFSLSNYLYNNITLRLDHFDNDCCAAFDIPLNSSEVLELVNKTVTDAVVNIVYSEHLSNSSGVSRNSSKGLVVDTHNMLVLMAGLLKQFGDIPQQDLLTEKNAEHIVSVLLNSSFSHAFAERDSRIKALEDKVGKIIPHLHHDSKSKNSTLVHSKPTSSPLSNGTTTPFPKSP